MYPHTPARDARDLHRHSRRPPTAERSPRALGFFVSVHHLLAHMSYI